MELRRLRNWRNGSTFPSMISKMDKIPEENEDFSVDVDGYNFKILSVEHKMIKSVLVTKKKQELQQNITIKNE